MTVGNYGIRVFVEQDFVLHTKCMMRFWSPHTNVSRNLHRIVNARLW